MTTNKKIIFINKRDLNRIKRYLKEEPANESDCLSEDDTIIYTAVFDGGYEMDIKCCGVQYREGESNLAWTEAVLFKDGSEICYTEPGEEFDGDWILDDGNTTFVVTVICEPTNNDVLSILSDCICEADEAGMYGLGDRLFEVITSIQNQYDMDTDITRTTTH